MQPIVTTIDIAVAPSAAFGCASDPTRFSEWQADVVTVRADRPVPLPVGARFHTTRRARAAPSGHSPRRWSSPTRRAGGPPAESTASGRTRSSSLCTAPRVTADFPVTASASPCCRWSARLTRRGAPVSYQRLRRILESV